MSPPLQFKQMCTVTRCHAGNTETVRGDVGADLKYTNQTSCGDQLKT